MFRKLLEKIIDAKTPLFDSYKVRHADFSHEAFVGTYIQIKKQIETLRRLGGFEEYQEFIDFLRSTKNIHIVPLKDLCRENESNLKITSIRFDVDIDPLTMLRLVHYNARFGIPSSVFLLHSAYYYGSFNDGVFLRSSLLKDWIRALIVSGCEIGLHNDGLDLYINRGINGAQAIETELAWLRSIGANICGTAAHNSYPAYHGENFELFRKYVTDRRKIGIHNGIKFPLGLLDECKLNLTYEANYPIGYKDLDNIENDQKITKWCLSTNSESVESEEWMKIYLHENPIFNRQYEVSAWHHGNRKWTISISNKYQINRNWYWKIADRKMFHVIASLPGKTRIVFLLHPIYFSKDTDAHFLNG